MRLRLEHAWVPYLLIAPIRVRAPPSPLLARALGGAVQETRSRSALSVDEFDFWFRKNKYLLYDFAFTTSMRLLPISIESTRCVVI